MDNGAALDAIRFAASIWIRGCKRYNPRIQKMVETMMRMRLAGFIAMVASALMCQAAHAASSPWTQPASSLAEEIAGILGPGQASLTIRNLSTIPNDEIPSIRHLLEQDLKARGVLVSGTESANTIRVTLSENVRERLWVAEVIEGNESRVAMVHVEPAISQRTQPVGGLTLRKLTVLTSHEAVLAALETPDGLIAVEPEEIVIYLHTAEGWREQKRIGIGQKRPLARDPRGAIFLSPSGDGFDIFVAGMACSGSNPSAKPAEEWTLHCRESDDPWILVQPPVTQASGATQGAATQMDISVTPFKAFYNAAHNYFTGVVNFSPGVDLPPFYSAAQIVRSASDAPMLIEGIDSKVQILENAALKPVAGTRDWGSDFATLQSGCGAGTQIVASGSGEAISDSLRAYELPAQEAIPASAPLTMDGTVTALWTAPDGKSLFAVVRNAADQYEVDRVSASCN
jgi:hypothetical protein